MVRKEPIKLYAEQAIATHLGHGWKFAFSNTKTILGDCDMNKKRIRVSVAFFPQSTYESVKQTILHEIAHGIDKCKHGHGPEWKAIAKSIGVKNPAAACNEVTQVGGGHLNLVCGECGEIVEAGRFRRSKVNHQYHKPCGESAVGKLYFVDTRKRV